MEIYQEPSSAVLCTTPGRKGVSFAGGSGGDDAARTPLSTRSGRKPLASYNHNTPNNTNIRPKGTPYNGLKKKLGEETSTATTLLQDKENSNTTATQTLLSSPTVLVNDAMARVAPCSNTTSATTPTSVPSFRRALRGKSPQQTMSTTTATSVVTIGQTQAAAATVAGQTKGVSFASTAAAAASNKPLGGGGGGRLLGAAARRPTGLLGVAGSSSLLGPPQRVTAPKTPNSLLRTELYDMYGDGDDDMMSSSSDYLDESLLVSPPGALWNVLGASHNPASASSTGLVIVPPHTAATIHEFTTSQKKKQQKSSQQRQQQSSSMAWASPPLQPRSLLQTTPESEVEEEETSLLVQQSSPPEESAKELIQENVAEESLSSPPLEANVQQLRKGVAMDLSTMFSEEKRPKLETKENTMSDKPTPPPHLLERLQKATVRSSAAAAKLDIETKLPSPTSKGPTHKASSAKDEVVEVHVIATPRGQGVSMDMSEVFASSSKITEATPPPRLLQRLQKPTVASTLAPKAGISNKKDTLKATVLLVEAEPVKEVVPESRGKGLSMDMTDMFSGVSYATATNTSKKMPQATPPPHLLKRLEQRTAQKASKSQPATGKENTSASTTSSAKGINLARPKADKSKSIKTAGLQKGPVRAFRPPVAKMEPKTRPPLQKNSKFFPKKAATEESSAKMNIQSGSPNAVSFEISAPKENKVAMIKKTPVKTRAPKAKSPIKIVREADDWAGKQCDTFVSWLNYTFQPDEDEDGGTGLRALVMHRRLAQVRFRATELFQSDAMRRARDIVQSEIARGRLAIRSDRDIHADLSLRKEATELLLSYTTPWLRLGLEVMFGECIMPPENLQDQQGDSQTVRLLYIF